MLSFSIEDIRELPDMALHSFEEVCSILDKSKISNLGLVKVFIQCLNENVNTFDFKDKNKSHADKVTFAYFAKLEGSAQVLTLVFLYEFNSDTKVLELSYGEVSRVKMNNVKSLSPFFYEYSYASCGEVSSRYKTIRYKTRYELETGLEELV